MSKPKYSLFIGRWQGVVHAGHRWLFDQQLNQGNNILIAIRDVEPDEKNPWTAEQVEANIHKEMAELIVEGRVKTMIIPDITDVNYGRGVGYGIIEHVPPPEIRDISATKIRAGRAEMTNCEEHEEVPVWLNCNCHSRAGLYTHPSGITVCRACGREVKKTGNDSIKPFYGLDSDK